jgi:hypothetical protein
VKPLEVKHLEQYLHLEVPTLVAEEVQVDLAEAALLVEVEDLAAVVVVEDKKTYKTCLKNTSRFH